MPGFPISRRFFLGSLCAAVPAWCVAELLCIEPTWVRVKRLRLGEDPSRKLVHFTDLHYKGDRAYLTGVIDLINGLSPDFVCFTGDIVESTAYLAEALDCMKELKAPTFGVPGNWDFVNGDSSVLQCFSGTGGAWLANEVKDFGTVRISGVDHKPPPSVDREEGRVEILLTHYPMDADAVTGEPYDLILAGHSHGGQVRLPFAGSLVVPDRVGVYDRGLFNTPGGQLYVNPGIGTWLLPVRFMCRPEITVFEL